MLDSLSSRLALLSILGVLVAAASTAPAASAATQRFASPTGGGTDCSSASPCSLTKAVEDATTGDEVIVSPGDYPLTATLIDGHSISIHGIAGQPRPRLLFSGGGQEGLWLQWSTTLRHVEIDQAAGGSGQAALIAFPGSEVDQVVAKALDVAVDARSATIRNSIAVASAANGRALLTAAIGSYTNAATYRNVTALATGSGGIAVEAYAWTLSSATVNLVNVIARGGPGGGYSLRASTDSGGATATINVSHSNWSGFSIAGTKTAVNDQGGKQIAVPAFVNAAAGDYRQAPGSPTIDAGVPSDDLLDVDGDPRTIGTTDIGADEFVAAPGATTGPAAAVTQQSAALSGSVDAKGAPTNYYFEYGPTSAYGNTTPSTSAGAGGGAVAAAATLDGLSSGTTYHYRLVATNAGGVAQGGDETFTTAGPPPDSGSSATSQTSTTQTTGAGAFAGVKLVSTRLTFGGKFITLKLSCSAGTVGRCSGRTKLSARRRARSGAASAVTLGRASFSIAAGGQAKVRIRVSRAGRRLLSRARRLRARDTNVALDGAGRSKTTAAAVTIRRR